MKERLFHVSEDATIRVFEPRAASFYSDKLKDNVVFAINDQMLHNYLLPRNCPRVTFYAGEATTDTDKKKFFGVSSARYIIAVEAAWLHAIQRTVLYCYEFLPETFTLFDECAGYYISKSPVVPVAEKPVYNLMESLLQRNVELRFMPSIAVFGEEVKKSSLQFSLIRMRNIKKEAGNSIDIMDSYSWPIHPDLTIHDLKNRK
ncbi:MAG: hypothetical protein QM802_19440 [Agriterribacter sp.]